MPEPGRHEEHGAGLETCLKENGYRIPNGASAVLQSYLKQNLKFFVAKVNLAEHSKLGHASLRPLQIAFESPKFMLPIRLGTVNVDGPQELFLYAITRRGRVEATNYRTVKLPEAQYIPVYVKDKCGDFYRDLFSQQVKRERQQGVFLEYAWDMAWCDPCASNPLSPEELRELGVFWLEDHRPQSIRQGQNAYVTRLHLRYDAAHVPEDLSFQEMADRSNFQARYILRHAWQGSDDCPAAREYRDRLRQRYEREAQTLASLTGWDLGSIRLEMKLQGGAPDQNRPWYERLWKN